MKLSRLVVMTAIALGSAPAWAADAVVTVYPPMVCTPAITAGIKPSSTPSLRQPASRCSTSKAVPAPS